MTEASAAATPHPRHCGIDFLRAACILYIVGYWHLIPYTESPFSFANWVTLDLTYVALATFVFCSGYLLGRHEVSLSPAGLWSFYRRRLLRIYPLYALAAVVLGLVGMASLAQVRDGLLLISMLNPPALPTLWFVTMIMVFYLVAPFLIRAAARPAIAVAVAAALILALIVVHLRYWHIDPRLVLYFPAFVLGILYRRQPALGAFVERYKWWILALAAVLLRLSWAGDIKSIDGVLIAVPLTLVGPVALFVFADRIASWLHGPTIAFLAYASFGLYLFHRQIFKGAVALYFPEDGWNQIIYLVGIALPVAIFVGYALQRGYDSLAARWSFGGK